MVAHRFRDGQEKVEHRCKLSQFQNDGCLRGCRHGYPAVDMLHFFHALKKEVDRVCLHPPARSQIDNQTRTVGFPYEFFDFIQEKPAVQFALPLRQLLHDCGSLACHTRFPRLLSLLLADRSTPPRSTVTLRSRCSKRVPSTTAFRTFNPGAM